MKLMKFFVSLVATLVSSYSIASSLSSDSPEYKQLVAMGYEVTSEGSLSVASNGSNRFVIDKNAERIAITRIFSIERKLTASDRAEALVLINKINDDVSYQVVLGDTILSVNLYYFAPHETRSFARVIRLIENANALFDAYPKLFEVLGGGKKKQG